MERLIAIVSNGFTHWQMSVGAQFTGIDLIGVPIPTGAGVHMWKAALPGMVTLVTVGLSLVSGEVIRREAEHKQVMALAQSSQPGWRSAAAQGAAIPAADHARPAPGRGVALIIGNAAYPDAGSPLAHPINNARRLAEELRQKGFDAELGENLTRHGMERAIDAFLGKVQPGATALIFFSGFGIQAGRKTYMIPVNAQIWSEDDVRRNGMSLEPVLAELESKGAGAKFVILDASRRNPFERRFRSASAGLAAVHAPDETLMMYAAAPGKVVNDNGGQHSLWMSELIAQIGAGGQTAEEAFHHTRIAVSRSSHREQVPWVSSTLVEDFYFTSPAGYAPSRQPPGS
jgi:hypothetical protein